MQVKTIKNKTVFVGVSGGVDSSVRRGDAGAGRAGSSPRVQAAPGMVPR